MENYSKERSKVYSEDNILSMVRRSIFYACGFTYEEIKKPLIAVVNTFNEMHPGHIHLNSLVDRVKGGVRSGGGVPLELGVLALCDGMAMGHEGMKYVLPSRQLIADSIELGLKAHRYDGAVLVGSCDKIIPAFLMAAARVDIPTVIVTGGPMLPGYWAREKKTVSISTLKEIGLYLSSDEIPEDIREEALASFFPCAGACWGMGTANTMACLSEALGMSMPGEATVPSVMSSKMRFAEEAGEAVMGLLRRGITPRKIMTKNSLDNAMRVNMAIGGSLNTVLHLPALAHELGFSLTLDDFERISKETPYLTHIEPAGPYHVTDLNNAGGIPAVLKRLSEKLDTTVVTVNGKSMAENIEKADVFDAEVIRPLDNPVHEFGGIAVLKGNLAEKGAVIKQVAVKEHLWQFKGPARVFNSEEEAVAGIGSNIKKGDVIVIRYEGPKGGPGMREMAFFRQLLGLYGMGETNYIITDGRFSGYSEGPSIGYLSPEAAEGGNICLVEDGDEIEIDIKNRTLDLKISESELEQRRKKFLKVHREVPPGYLQFFSRFVSSASEGSVFKLDDK